MSDNPPNETRGFAEWEATRHEAEMSVSALITIRTKDDAISQEIGFVCDAQEAKALLSGFGIAVEQMTRRIVSKYVPSRPENIQ